MIKKVLFQKDYRCFKAGDLIEFKPITLLVGDQGCGKSTLLQLLSGADKQLSKDVLRISADRVNTRSFDYEKNNPRLSHTIETTFDLAVRHSSHGEFVKLLNKTICDTPNVLWLLDEPDSALSVRSCMTLAKCIKSAVCNGCQVVASIHSSVVMSQFENVYSVEHRKWMLPGEFIITHIM